MKKPYFTTLFSTSLLSTGLLLLGLSQAVLASQKDFVLTSANDVEMGHGNYEELPYATAKVVVNMQDVEYAGTAVINQSTPSFSNGMRNNRSRAVTKLKKQVSVDLVSADDKKLSCEINRLYSDLWGSCVDPVTQKTLRVQLRVAE